MPTERALRRLLYVHRDSALADRIRRQLGRIGDPLHALAHFGHLVDGLTYLQVSPVDVVLVGPEPADCTLLEAVRKLGSHYPETPVVAVLAKADPQTESQLRQAGAKECLSAESVEAEVWSRAISYCLREMAITHELAEATARLDWMVHMDSLTGMLNRKGLERVIMTELGRCRQSRSELMVLLVDIDDFTRMNGTLGHGVGDMILVAASRRITESLRPNDQAGRCGTDRFMVMMPDTDLEGAEAVAEQIRLAISRDTITAGQHQLNTTASLGVASISRSTLSFDEVLARVHFVLQRSKLQGKNRVTRAASVQDVNLVGPVETGPELVRSLLRGRVLEVASQPIVNLMDGRIVSREMLVRGPAGPLRSPDNLFRFCQEQDILAAVDLRCLKQCASTAARLGPQGRFHVNIMPATLLQTPVEELVRVLKVSGAEGHCILEISEQQLLGDPSVLVGPVRRLQEAGIGIAVDDVGFGNSCLEGLLVLQPQIMKVDKRLVRGLEADPDLRKTLKRLLAVGAVLGAEVVAEGIEEPGDLRVLLDLGRAPGAGLPVRAAVALPAGRPSLSPPPGFRPGGPGRGLSGNQPRSPTSFSTAWRIPQERTSSCIAV